MIKESRCIAIPIFIIYKIINLVEPLHKFGVAVAIAKANSEKLRSSDKVIDPFARENLDQNLVVSYWPSYSIILNKFNTVDEHVRSIYLRNIDACPYNYLTVQFNLQVLLITNQPEPQASPLSKRDLYYWYTCIEAISGVGECLFLKMCNCVNKFQTILRLLQLWPNVWGVTKA